MWELKPEYRHYKSDEAAEGGSAGLVVIVVFVHIFIGKKIPVLLQLTGNKEAVLVMDC